MKAFGMLMVVFGLLMMAAPAITSLWKDDKEAPPLLTSMVLSDKDGESMSLYPLLGIVSFATGAAMIVAGVLTKKGGKQFFR